MKPRDPAKIGPLVAGRRTPRGRLDTGIQSEIGKALRVMYDDVLKQGVPDRFANLLAKLDDARGDDESPEK
jgi:hypothetical protein